MKKEISVAAVISAVILISVSCRKSEGDPNRDEARNLYERVTELTRRYTDSIRTAPDTTRVNELLERFEERIDKMNFEVPADTDYSLTEGENDTISLLLAKMANVRRERFKALGVAQQPVDSTDASHTDHSQIQVENLVCPI